MKTRKVKIAVLTFALMLGTTTFQSCKKGENDPFLSLKTRDARITGTWELESMTSRSVDSYLGTGGEYYSEYTSTLADGQMTSTSTGSASGLGYSYSSEMTIKKDGTLIISETSEDDKSTTTASWYWMNDTKKKTRINLNGDFEVDRLTNKELILKTDDIHADSNENGSSTSSYSSTMTFKKKK
jgi:hypothetical protein